jgi:hypothetical protein
LKYHGKIVFQNLRSKLQNRRAPIAACSHQEFLSYSRQFFGFVEATPALRALIVELLARNSECEKREFAAMHAQIAFASGPPSLGDTAGEAATIAYVRWKTFAGQDSPHAFIGAFGFCTGSPVSSHWSTAAQAALTPAAGQLYQICSGAAGCYPTGGTWEFSVAEPHVLSR